MIKNQKSTSLFTNTLLLLVKVFADLKECKPIFLFTGLSRNNDSNVDSPDVRHVVMDCYWRRKTDLFPCFSMISMSAFNIFWMLSGWADGSTTTTTIIVTAQRKMIKMITARLLILVSIIQVVFCLPNTKVQKIK